MGLNISALAEEKLIERIKEIESLEQSFRSKLNNLQGKSDNQNTNNEIKSNSQLNSMGPPRFELESLAPKAKRIDQATLRAPMLFR